MTPAWATRLQRARVGLGCFFWCHVVHWIHLRAGSVTFLRTAAVVLMLAIGGCKQLALFTPSPAGLAIDLEVLTWNPRDFATGVATP